MRCLAIVSSMYLGRIFSPKCFDSALLSRLGSECNRFDAHSGLKYTKGRVAGLINGALFISVVCDHQRNVN